LVNHQNNASKELYEKQDLASNGYDYDLNDEQVWNILDQLPDEYLTSYSKWLTVTSVLKRHGKHAIWSEWSKRGGNYNEAENERKWNSNEGILDINYLTWVLNQNGGNVEQIPKHKKYSPINQLPTGWQQQVGNKQYVSDLLDYETFGANETIVIQSCTGTGKNNSDCQTHDQRRRQMFKHCHSHKLGRPTLQIIQSTRP
jgi:hypothetical protein